MELLRARSAPVFLTLNLVVGARRGGGGGPPSCRDPLLPLVGAVCIGEDEVEGMPSVKSFISEDAAGDTIGCTGGREDFLPKLVLLSSCSPFQLCLKKIQSYKRSQMTNLKYEVFFYTQYSNCFETTLAFKYSGTKLKGKQQVKSRPLQTGSENKFVSIL